MWSQLSPDVLTVVYQNFSKISDIARSSLVCRGWAVNLWRPSAQAALWFPFVLDSVRNSASLYNSILRRKMMEHKLKRTLVCESCDVICEFLKGVIKMTNDENESMARSLNANFETRRRQLLYGCDVGLISVSAGQLIACVPSAEEPKAIYRFGDLTSSTERLHIYCLTGSSFDPFGRLRDTGEVIVDGTVYYRGAFQLGLAHGKGTMYCDNGASVKGDFERGRVHGYATFHLKSGAIKYDGEWDNGKQHGKGMTYHDESSTPLFKGRYDQGKMVEGDWFGLDGECIHSGDYRWFEEQLKLHVTTRHQCTFAFTKTCYTKQRWWRCADCFSLPSQGCCEVCVVRCHKGHNVTLQPESEFYCDCSASGNSCDAKVPDESICDLPVSDNEAKEQPTPVPQQPQPQPQPQPQQPQQRVPVEVFRQQIQGRIREMGGHVRVFFEIEPQNFTVIDVQLVREGEPAPHQPHQ